MEGYEIDRACWVQINGDRQNIRLLGRRAGSPVLLFLHGGPGVCDRHLVIRDQRPLAERFTLALWDQRGSGKSFSKEGLSRTVHVEDYVSDGEAVIRWLCRELGCEKVVLVCHSWGTVIGVQLAQRLPGLVRAYIGQGQFVNGAENEMLSYRFCLEEARRRKDRRAEKKLLAGPPEQGRYPSHKAMMVQRDCLSRYGGGVYQKQEGMVRSLLVPLLRTKEYGLRDIPGYAKGATHLTQVLWDEVVACSFDQTVRELEMPVMLTMGRHDYNTPAELAWNWFEQLKAPRKEWVWFEQSAHSPIQEEPDRWGRAVEAFCLSLREAG